MRSRETFDCAAAVQAGVVAQSLVFLAGIDLMAAFFVSTGIVALAEMGDKTQLLALLLAARFKKPWTIVIGIFVATVINHALAGALGAWITTVVNPQTLRWLLGASFVLMAGWMLIPDKLEDNADSQAPRLGVFASTVVVFSWPRWATKPRLQPSCWRPNTRPTPAWWPAPRSA